MQVAVTETRKSVESMVAATLVSMTKRQLHLTWWKILQRNLANIAVHNVIS